MAQRLRDPIVRESQDSIVIVLAADVVPEPHPHCGLTTDKDQRARITISLDTRVGNRSLFDGSSWPLRDAHKQSDPIIWCCG